MHLNLPPDLETLVNKRLSTGAYADAEDVLRRALEAQDAEESWTDEERRAFTPFLDIEPRSQLHRCLPARHCPASNRGRAARKAEYPARSQAAP